MADLFLSPENAANLITKYFYIFKPDYSLDKKRYGSIGFANLYAKEAREAVA